MSAMSFRGWTCPVECTSTLVCIPQHQVSNAFTASVIPLHNKGHKTQVETTNDLLYLDDGIVLQKIYVHIERVAPLSLK